MKHYVMALTALCWVTSAFAANELKLQHVVGRVGVVRAGAKTPEKATDGTVVKAGDTIVTAEKGLALLAADGSTLKIGESTTFFVSSGTEFELKNGSVFSKVDKGPNASKFHVRARSVTMGVRGTMFFTAFGKNSDVWMCVNEGEVQVAAPGQKDTHVKEGEGINVLGGKKVTPPKKYSWTKKLNWNMDPASGDLENKVKMREAYGDLLNQNYD